MRDDPSPALLSEALASLVERAGASRRILVLDATRAIVAACDPGAGELVAIQPWRPHFDALVQGGIAARPCLEAADSGFAIALVALGRSHARNLARIAEAIARTEPGGWIAVAGSNELGAARYARLAGATRTIARHRGRAFVLARAGAPDRATLEAWRAGGAARRHADTGHVAAPGAFAWDRIDAGSRLLAAALPRDIAGEAADLGAGWGHLSAHLAATCPGLRRIDLHEADHEALDAARANLATAATRVEVGFLWTDVARGLGGRSYDAIVSNLPFHDTRGADPAIGIAFIRAAARALRPGGRCWLVANRHLPY
ncbi:MAG: class I SAM-dependent methyltransferase, partial [Alphaproteobacteria bacterium]